MTTDEQAAFDDLKKQVADLTARLSTERAVAATNAQVNLAQLKTMFEGKIVAQTAEIAALKK